MKLKYGGIKANGYSKEGEKSLPWAFCGKMWALINRTISRNAMYCAIEELAIENFAFSSHAMHFYAQTIEEMLKES